MSETNCKECGHPTEWAQDIGSAVCTHCGTLADPSQQSALASSLDSFPCDVPSYAPRTTLKSIRRNAAWDLPGQSSDSRNDRNKVLSLFNPFSPFSTYRSPQLTIHNLIRTLADRLGHHGVGTRAQAIFDSTMQCTSMKWGKAARLAAGAAVVFALREQGRGDRTHYVAVSSSISSFPRPMASLASFRAASPMLDALWLWPCFFSALLVSCPFSLSPVIGVNSNQVL
jgi:transcription factor IIIB subunit 2